MPKSDRLEDSRVPGEKESVSVLAWKTFACLNRQMEKPVRRSRRRVPYNPGLGSLVLKKRKWSSPPNCAKSKAGFLGWHERGYLPHRDEPGLTQFVTFRLADSFPESLRFEREHLFKIADERARRTELEIYLDKGKGEHHLSHPAVAKIVEDALKYFHGERYDLRAWVIMSNHVHVLFKVTAMPMSKVIENWKKFTSKQANKLLNRCGEFWAPDYWDTFMRDSLHEARSRKYIEHNPTKCGLVVDPKLWHWSSARLRDTNGALKL